MMMMRSKKKKRIFEAKTRMAKKNELQELKLRNERKLQTQATTTAALVTFTFTLQHNIQFSAILMHSRNVTCISSLAIRIPSPHIAQLG